MLVMLVEPMGVRFPQGSEFSGEVSAFFCLSVWCVLTAGGGTADGAADAIG